MTNIDYSDSTPDISFAYYRIGQQTQGTDGRQGVHYFYYDPATLALTNERVVGRTVLEPRERDKYTSAIPILAVYRDGASAVPSAEEKTSE